jgi:RimJ/RimL family protein N-acetyltransferase
MNFDVFCAGKNIDLVVVTREMASSSNWWRWFNDETVTCFMKQHYYPNTPESQMDFCEHLRSDKTKLQLGVAHKKDGVLIGMVSLNKIDHLHRNCEVAGLIGERKYRNVACAFEAFRLLIIHAFDQLNMHRVYGGTMLREVADMFVRVLGFTDESVSRQDVFKNGCYHDVYRIGLLQHEFEAWRTGKDDAGDEI